MVNCPAFHESAADARNRGTAEIGMHLHAWNSPPIAPLANVDYADQPYLVEYPGAQLREKVKALTDALESTFGTKMLSHRAGRWAFNEVYAEVLVENGYRVDCSVTPHVSWKAELGDPAGTGGSDYTGFPNSSYWMDPSDVSQPGSPDRGSGLLEVPMTVMSMPIPESPKGMAVRLLRPVGPLGRRVAHRLHRPIHDRVAAAVAGVLLRQPVAPAPAPDPERALVLVAVPDPVGAAQLEHRVHRGGGPGVLGPQVPRARGA